MSNKDSKTWDENDEVQTVELDSAHGGAASTKSITNQSGGDESAPRDETPDSSGPEELV